MFLDQFVFELSCKNTYTHTNTHTNTHTHTHANTHTHTHSNEYPIVAFSKKATIITVEVQAQTSNSVPQLTHLLVIDMLSPQSYQNLVEEKDELDSYMYMLRFECYTENASWEKNMWAIKLSALLSG